MAARLALSSGSRARRISLKCALAGLIVVSLGVTSATLAAASGLKPSPVGYGQCDAAIFTNGSVYAQVAIADSTCSVAAKVASKAGSSSGKKYKEDGFTCQATKEAKGSKWSSAWGGTYFAYSCHDGSSQVAFNWGKDYTYAEITNPAESSSNVLEPAAVGYAECSAFQFADKSVYAQVATLNATCSVAATVAAGSDVAKGAKFKADGFACKSTKEGKGSEWALAWGSKYFAYTCKDGSSQVAFNWGTDYTY